MRVRHSLNLSWDLASRLLARSSSWRRRAAAAAADRLLPRGTISDAPCSSRENPDWPIAEEEAARSRSSSTAMSRARMSCADVAPIGAAAGVASDMDSELSLCDILSSEWRRHSGLSAREPDVAALTT